MLIQAVLLGVTCAVPVAVSPSWGWLLTLALAAGGGLAITADLHRRYLRPVEHLAEAVRPYVDVPGASTQDLARLVAYEYRDAVSQLEAALAEARRREVALSSAGDGVILLDGNGLVEFTNQAARSLLQANILELSHRLSEPQLERLVALAVRQQSPAAEELTLRMPAARHVLARAIPLAAAGVVVVLQDLSEAYRLDRVRRDFVANVSHELKTPVAGMRALSDVAVSALADGELATAQRFVERIQLEAERLSDLVSDLLDLSRVESGQDFQVEPVDLRTLVDDAAARVRPAAEAKGLAVEIDAPSLQIEADPSQLGAALQNLIDNAVRYSDAGTVRVRVSALDGWITIAVSDEGIGIPAKELPRIFERFYRVDRARSRATGGTGLGLAIVRHVAENHGGRVDVQSELGRGSTFTLLVPGPMQKGDAA